MPPRPTKRLADRPVIVTGASGRLGHGLVHALRETGAMVVPVGRADFDLGGREAVLNAVARERPDTIFHCAAMTAVDACEQDPDAAYRVNAIGTRNICEAAQRNGARVVLISTDYVFSGEKALPYDEFDEPSPRSIYGRSKLAAERFVQSLGPTHAIVRTSRIFGGPGKNFVRSIVEKAKASPGSTIEAVTDQLAVPTYAPDLAWKLIEVAEMGGGGIYHVTSGGPAVSWYELAEKTLDVAGLRQRVHLVRGTTAERPRPAPRPKNGALLGRVAALEGISPLRSWHEALAEYVRSLEPAAGEKTGAHA